MDVKLYLECVCEGRVTPTPLEIGVEVFDKVEFKR
jgi:hypothetical protein